MMTVDVTPSPQAFSWLCASETKALAAGCFTRSSETIFAPSLVTAVCPDDLYIILSNPLGPYVRRKIFPKAMDASTSFWVTATPLVMVVLWRTILTGPRPEPSVFGGIMMTQIPSLQECCFQKRKR